MVCDEGNFRIYLQISTFFFFFFCYSGFKSQTSRPRSWALVSTASESTSSSSQSTATPASSTPSNKPWHEVSRAIT